MDDAAKLQIMIVDDDAMITSLLAMMLTDMGHSVCAVADSEAGAVAAAVSSAPGLMIVDARLGDGSGVDAIDTILRAATVPYILMSGGAIDNGRPGAIVLAKPFREADLKRAIRRATAGPGIAA